MVYNCYKMGSYNIHTIKTDRFKNIRMEIIFRNNITYPNVVTRSLLFELLLESSKDYKTKRDIILKCEELYNANIYTQSMKSGGMVLSTVVMDFLNPKYTKDDYLSEAISLPFEIIFNPDFNLNECNNEKLETVKLRALADLEAQKENPKNYTILKALESGFKNSISSINLLGTKEDILNIFPTDIYNEYMNILEHDYVDIYVIGDIEESKIIDIINKNVLLKTIKNHGLNLYVDNKTRSKERIVKEKADFSQDHIVYLLNVLDLSKYESSYVMHVFNNIMGGSSLDSRLYKKLRGENSLCYSAGSIYNKYDGLIIIYTSVDHENIGIAKKLINEVIKSMKSISEEDVSAAVLNIITSIKLSYDQPKTIISNYLFHDIADFDLIDERIKNYSKVTVKDVEKLIKHISINTIYIAGDNHE